MKVDFDKVGVISCYLAQNTKGLYVTKLLKLFYYIDFIAFAQRGASVTGDKYYKLPYGPVPTMIKNDLDLISNSLLEDDAKAQLSKYIALETDDDNFGTLIKCKVTDPDLKRLSSYELKVVKAVASTFSKTRAKALSTQTHSEKPWRLSSLNSPMDYELAKELDIAKIVPALA